MSPKTSKVIEALEIEDYKVDQHFPLYFKINYINECTYIFYEGNQK